VEKLLLLGKPLADGLFKEIIKTICFKGYQIITLSRSKELNKLFKTSLPVDFKNLITQAELSNDEGFNKVLDKIHGAIVFPGELNTKRDLLILIAFAKHKSSIKILLADWTKAQLDSFAIFLDFTDKENNFDNFLSFITSQRGTENLADSLNWLVSKAL